MMKVDEIKIAVSATRKNQHCYIKHAGLGETANGLAWTYHLRTD